MGSAQSARGIQPRRARVGRPVSGGSPRWDLSPVLAVPRRAHFLRGGAPRPALGRLGRVWGRRWLAASAASFTAPPRPDFAASRGRGLECSLRPLGLSPLSGGGSGTGPPRSRRDCQPGRTVLSAPQPRRVARAGIGPRTTGVRGQRRCRQPTRPVLKHGPRSLTHARVRGSSPLNPTAQ